MFDPIKDDVLNSVFKKLLESNDFALMDNNTVQILELFSTLTDISVWIMNAEFSFTFVTKTIEQITGYSAEEFNIETFRALMTPKSHSLFMHIKEMILNSEFDNDDSIIKLDVEIIKRNEQKSWVEISIHPFYKQNTYIGVLGFCRDISSRKLIEKELIKNRNRYLTFFWCFLLSS